LGRLGFLLILKSGFNTP